MLTIDLAKKRNRERIRLGSNQPRPDGVSVRETQKSRAEAILAREISFVMNDTFRAADLNTVREEVRGLLERSNGSAKPDENRTVAGWTAGPLINPAEEARHFWLFNFLKFRANSVRTTMDPQRPTKAACDLFDDLMQLAQAVRERIICGNLRLVISIAKNCKSVDLTFDELCSEGVLALMRAVDCFNIDRGFRFSTYAYTAIARAVHREAGEARIRGQRQINGVPTSTLERFEEMDAEASINEDSLGRSGELLRKLMGELNPREQLVINARYGIDRDQPQLTFQRLGEILGVSKERVRQIEARALRELKRMAQELALYHFPESLIEGPAS